MTVVPSLPCAPRPECSHLLANRAIYISDGRILFPGEELAHATARGDLEINSSVDAAFELLNVFLVRNWRNEPWLKYFALRVIFG